MQEIWLKLYFLYLNLIKIYDFSFGNCTLNAEMIKNSDFVNNSYFITKRS